MRKYPHKSWITRDVYDIPTVYVQFTYNGRTYRNSITTDNLTFGTYRTLIEWKHYTINLLEVI